MDSSYTFNLAAQKFYTNSTFLKWVSKISVWSNMKHGTITPRVWVMMLNNCKQKLSNINFFDHDLVLHDLLDVKFLYFIMSYWTFVQRSGKQRKIHGNTFNIIKPPFQSFRCIIPTKKVWVKLINIIDDIVTLGTSVAVLQALADALKTTGWGNKK